MNRSGKKCVLYPRVSTEMHVDHFCLQTIRRILYSVIYFYYDGHNR